MSHLPILPTLRRRGLGALGVQGTIWLSLLSKSSFTSSSLIEVTGQALCSGSTTQGEVYPSFLEMDYKQSSESSVLNKNMPFALLLYFVISLRALWLLPVLKVPKTTFSLHDWLGLTGPRKAIVFTVMGYYSERIQIKISKGKGTSGRVQERPDTSFQLSSLVESHGQHLIPPAMNRHSMCKALPTREAHLSFDF